MKKINLKSIFISKLIINNFPNGKLDVRSLTYTHSLGKYSQLK